MEATQVAELKTKIKLRNDTTENWNSNSTVVLDKGEIGIEYTVDGKAKIKIGDGAKQWSQLEYLNADSESAIATLQQQITTLNGDGAGSVKKTAEEQATAAINKWAQETSENEIIDTFKEIVDYIGTLGEASQLLSDISGLKIDVQGLQTSVGNKVDKNNDDRLMTQAEATKLEGITAGAEPNYISSVSEEFTVEAKKLSVKAIDKSKITGLTEQLGSYATTDSMNQAVDAAKEALLGEEKPGVKEEYESKDPTIYDIAEKLMNLETHGSDISIATAEKAGIVKSASEENTVTVDVQGKMTLNSLNVNKLTQTEGEELVLNCGGAGAAAE